MNGPVLEIVLTYIIIINGRWMQLLAMIYYAVANRFDFGYFLIKTFGGGGVAFFSAEDKFSMGCDYFIFRTKVYNPINSSICVQISLMCLYCKKMDAV